MPGAPKAVPVSSPVRANKARDISDRRFHRTARLLSAADYQRVFDGPRRSADRWFTVLAVNNQVSRARLGLAISKKQARRAVDRNRLKRLIRESFRCQREQFDGTDLVVMARSAALSINNAKLRESLERHFSKLAGPMRAQSIPGKLPPFSL
jgi:ribonuclease P protein component